MKQVLILHFPLSKFLNFDFFRFFIIGLILLNFEVLRVTSIKINCDYAAINFIISECTVRNLEVKNPYETVRSISGTLSSVINYDNITTFKVVESPQLEYLPSGIEKFFPNVEEIEIFETGLKELSQKDLKSFPKLKTLIVRENQLESLDKNVFQFNDIVEEIDLSGNKLSHLPANSLRILKNLKKLDLSGNVCINATATTPRELRKLKSKLSDQCLRSPPVDKWSFMFTLLLALLLAALFVCLLIFCVKYIVS